MNILVTGASGFIGRHVVPKAIGRGHRVRALVRPASSLESMPWTGDSRIEIVRGDLRSSRNLDELVAGVDLVIHLAASKADEFFEAAATTVVGTENLLAAMRAAGIRRIVLVSSFAVYGYFDAKTRSRLTEESSLERNPESRGTYCLTKLMQEQLVVRGSEDHELTYTILRPGAVYGEDHLWTSRVGMKLSRNTWICIGPLKRLPMTYVENCAEAIVMCAESDAARSQIYNVVDNDCPTTWTYCKQLRSRSVPRPRVVFVPWSLMRAVGRTIWFLDGLVFRHNAPIPSFLKPINLHSRYKPLRFPNVKLKAEIGWEPKITMTDAIEASVRAQTSESLREVQRATL